MSSVPDDAGRRDAAEDAPSGKVDVESPEKQAFYGLFGSIASALEFYHKSSPDPKSNLGPAYEIIRIRAEACATVDECRQFYQELARAFTAFFGFEHRGQGVLGEEITQILGMMGMRAIRAVDLSNTKSLCEIIACTRQKIGELRHERSSAQFDMTAYIADIFDRDQQIDRETFKERVRQSACEVPGFVHEGMVRFLDQFKPLNISRKVFKRTLNDIVSRGTKESPVEEELQQAVEKISLLDERRFDIISFHLFSFLRAAGVPLDNIVSAMSIDPTSFHFFAANSLYNGAQVNDAMYYRALIACIEAKTLLRAMYVDDFIEITRLLCDIASGVVPPDEICLRVGVGGTDTPVPARILSYITGPLAIAGRFRVMYNKTPHVELFTGQEGAIACNKSDSAAVRQNTKTVFSFIDSYVRDFFPDLAERFDVVQDIPWTENTKVHLVVEFLEQVLLKYVNEDTDMARIAGELARRGNGHGKEYGGGSALKYAAFHIVCFTDIPAVTEYITGHASSHRHIISVGGDAEREFIYIRRLLVKHFTDPKTGAHTFAEHFNRYLDDHGLDGFSVESGRIPLSTRASVITGTGINPPYYLATHGGDIALDEVAGKSPDEIMRIYAERVVRALILMHNTDNKVAGHAQSFLKGVAIVASRVPLPDLADFLSRQSFTSSDPEFYD